MTKKPGRYIVIEGPDGTGKTTQADLLQKYLEEKGTKTLHVKEPGGTPMGEAIRGVILNGTLERSPMTNLLLFTANRHELWFEKIKHELAAGNNVIATRNYWSSLVFQGYAEGMNLDVIRAVTATFTEDAYMHPDISIILTFHDETERKRRIAERGTLTNADPFESQPDDFQQKILHGYKELASAENITNINASGSIDEVQREIRTILSL